MCVVWVEEGIKGVREWNTQLMWGEGIGGYGAEAKAGY
jgi:hypothetical protein